ncbi:hypothetical protein C2869_16295 [Saccharobesus litoralis]|uniref:Uncharacterized protein n=1 Tax=Saccharobesus litoralis TaxID=2172099 RepID=A0A2S0VUK4_9ALTE|nr:hypothetical protein [Saccharobesus litoralis]AWB67888.1 hypothetical protein C2869_16295 [Saccharobesus litoralis]
MKDTQSNPYIRQYQRKSKSPWDDASTILLLADVVDDELSFERYIYLHRDSLGRILGISISKRLLDDNPDLDSRYLDDVEMYAVLLMYIDEISLFCERFAEEFEAIFGLDPSGYFEAAELRWYSIIRDI